MPFGLGNADDISSTGMLYADPHSELVHRSWNSETLPIVSKQKWTSFAFPLPDSYLLRLEQLFPSTIYIIGHGCCAVVGESAVCRYYIYMAFLWRHNIYNMNSTSHQSPVQTNHTTTLLIFLSLFRRRFLGARNCITASTSTHGSRGGAGSTSNQPLRSLEAFRHMADLDLDLCWSRRRNNAIFGRRGTLTRQNELKWKKWNFKLSWCLYV